MATKISLSTRKNLKDNEAKLKTHLDKLAEVTGITFEVEADWPPIVEAVEAKGYKDRTGDFFYDSYLAGLSKEVEKFCKVPLQKEAFVEAFGERHTIHYQVLPAEPRVKGYEQFSDANWVSCVNGVLTINIYRDRIPQDANTTGSKGMGAAVSGDGPLSIEQRKNISDQAPAMQKHVDKIAAASGVSFDVEVDWAEAAAATEAKGYKGRVGDFFYDKYLGVLAAAIEKFCKDPIYREAFNDTFSGRHAIGYQLAPADPRVKPYETENGWISNANGVLMINLYRDRIPSSSNVAEKGLSEACSDGGPLTLDMRKNISDATKCLNAHIKKIGEASGIEDFEVDVDWAEFAKSTVIKGYRDRVGDIVYDWYLKGLANQIEKFCKNAIQKEAFGEAFGSRKTIAFFLTDEDSPRRNNTTTWTKCQDGVLEVRINRAKFTQNAAETGDDLTESTSGEGPLSVAMRRNISDSAEARAAFIAKINAAAGIEFDYEVDWISFAPVAEKKGYGNRLGETAGWYLKALANHIEKVCSDELGKEAFAETCDKKMIMLKVVDSVASGDVTSTFEDGVLVVSVAKDRFGVNADATGSDIMGRL